MKTIKINSNTTKEQLSRFAQTWNESENIALSMPEDLSKDEIRHLFLAASEILPMELGFCVLQELAESKHISHDLLSEIISIGDRACIETVCLRGDLSPELRKKCKEISIHESDMNI